MVDQLFSDNDSIQHSKLNMTNIIYLKIPLAICFFDTYFGSKFGFLTKIQKCKFKWIIKII